MLLSLLHAWECTAVRSCGQRVDETPGGCIEEEEKGLIEKREITWRERRTSAGVVEPPPDSEGVIAGARRETGAVVVAAALSRAETGPVSEEMNEAGRKKTKPPTARRVRRSDGA